ncbi:MAG: TipAS antibiotic-recognition domain-containing protein [Anaerolineae bacterium]|nr:TipAS antibiotic-recognition domain-containing protein [Anaerolineae bacterium]
MDATGAETLDAETVSAIILGVSGGDGATWMRRYYSDDAWRGLQTRWLAYPPEEMARVAQAWADLHAAFAVHRGAPPDSPAVQRLAAQMDALIEAFTGGDPDTLAGLERFSADAEAGALPPGFEGYAPYEGVDAETQKLMREAWQIHRRRRKK